MNKCPNCKEKFERKPDAEYKYRIVHEVSTCPYGFDIAHDNPKILQANIDEHFRTKKLR